MLTKDCVTQHTVRVESLAPGKSRREKQKLKSLLEREGFSAELNDVLAFLTLFLPVPIITPERCVCAHECACVMLFLISMTLKFPFKPAGSSRGPRDSEARGSAVLFLGTQRQGAVVSCDSFLSRVLTPDGFHGASESFISGNCDLLGFTPHWFKYFVASP